MTTLTAQSPAELTLRDIYLQAATHIERVGLNRNDFFPKEWHGKGAYDVPCCAAAAIGVAGRMTVTQILDGHATKLVAAAEQFLAEHIVRLGGKEEPDPVDVIGTWNDQDGMTAAEVAEILRDVAELAR